MAPSTRNSLDVDSVAPAVVEWKCGDDDATTRYLSDPDPRSGDLIFETRYVHQASAGFFKLRIPIRLKGIDCDTHLLVPIHPDSIASFECETQSASPGPVQKKLECDTVCLRFRLHRPLDMVVPVATTVPLLPKRKASGDILDALRSLSRTTTLAVYVPDKELVESKVQAICQAISQARLKPLDRQDDLGSLYSGDGGKIVDLSTSLRESPPSYNEVDAPPPMAPVAKHNESNKRQRRASSSDEGESRLDAIWTELMTIRKDKTQYQEQIAKLEERVGQLEKDKEDMRQEIHDLRHELEESRDEVHVVETDVIDLRQGLGDVEEHLEGIEQNGLDVEVEERIVDSVTERVIDNIIYV